MVFSCCHCNYQDSDMHTMTFDMRPSDTLCVFGKRDSDKSAVKIRMISGGTTVSTQSFATETFHQQLQLMPRGQYEYIMEGGSVLFAYLERDSDIREKGLTVLFPKDPYGVAFRNQIHFSPVTGWMNDPNGLCVHGDLVHMFYQYNPYAQVWGNMHWGHAVSNDLVHWKHLPVVFYPQPELQYRNELRGGAFSGSALVSGENISAYFTRHYGAIDRAWGKEWQVKATSTDGLHFENEHPIIHPDIPGVSSNFRDPRIFVCEDRYYLVIGGRKEPYPTVFLYESRDSEHWEFVSLLYQEKESQYKVAECPDMFQLDGEWVLVVGFTNARPQPPWPRDVFCFTGDFDGRIFKPKTRTLIDYGHDFFAPQSVVYQERRICFGWNNESLIQHEEVPGGANGTASLPREWRIEKGKLIQKPAEEIKNLYADSPAARAPCYIEINDCGDSFSLILFEGFVLFYGNGKLSLSDGRSFPVADLQKLEIFLDISCIELFINCGKQVASWRYYLEGSPHLILSLEGKGVLTSCNMHDIWEKKYESV